MELKTITIKPLENIGTALEIKATFVDGTETVTRSKVIQRTGKSMKLITDLTDDAVKLFGINSPTR